MNRYYPGQPVALTTSLLVRGVAPNPPLSNVVVTLQDPAGVDTILAATGTSSGVYEADWLAPFGPYGEWKLQWSTSGIAIPSNGYTEDRFLLAHRNF